jgi:hypothetical protein
MIGHFRALETLRRRRRGVIATVVPLVVTVWFGTAASLCFGMTTDAARNDRISAHDHAEHAHDGGNRHDQSSSKPHGHCPHCPPSSGTDTDPASHASCSTLDDVTDGRHAPATPKPDLVPTMLAARIDPALLFDGGVPARRVAKRRLPREPSVPLNLRHCVLTI